MRKHLIRETLLYIILGMLYMHTSIETMGVTGMRWIVITRYTNRPDPLPLLWR